jgi:thiamine biosynthesis lipoprotein
VSAPAIPRPGDALAYEEYDGWRRARWHALGGPCELLVDDSDAAHAAELAELAAAESLRIERRFSRYRPDSVLAEIHAAHGRPVVVDEETAHLLDYAAECHAVSGGRFDITSGVLRHAWTFDGGSRVPDAATLHALLARVGWSRVGWRRPELMLPDGMELDLGGIGKEYAVDRAAAAVAARAQRPFLVNFGGDLFTPRPRTGGRAWSVGIDDPERSGVAATHRVDLERGGLATSGDARRYVMWQGRRLGHILDPRTGWPVEGAPRSVTVLAPTCLEAGTLATLAILQGAGARAFLESERVQFELVESPGA